MTTPKLEIKARQIFSAWFWSVLYLAIMAALLLGVPRYTLIGQDLLSLDGRFATATPAITSHWQFIGDSIRHTPATKESQGSLAIPANPAHTPRALYRIPVWKDADYFIVRSTIRAQGITPGAHDWEAGRSLLYFPDGNGRTDFTIPHQAGLVSGSTDWISFEQPFPIQANSDHAILELKNQGQSGTLLVSKVSVHPANASPLHRFLRNALAIGWLLGLIYLTWKTRVWDRPNGPLLLIIVALIVVGMLLPNQSLKAVTQTAKSLISNSQTPAPQQTAARQAMPATPTSSATSPRSTPAPSLARPATQPALTLEFLKSFGHFWLFLFLGLSSYRVIRKSKLTITQNIYTVLTLSILFAIATEVLQLSTIDRQASLDDAMIDSLGISIGTVIAAIFDRLRRKNAMTSPPS